MANLFFSRSSSNVSGKKVTIQYCDDHPWFNMNIGNDRGWFCPFDGKRMNKKTMTENAKIGWDRGRREHLSQFGVVDDITEVEYLNIYYELNKKFNMMTGEPIIPQEIESR